MIANKEHEADDAAASSMREPLSLANTLIKVAAFTSRLLKNSLLTQSMDGLPNCETKKSSNLRDLDGFHPAKS